MKDIGANEPAKHAKRTPMWHGRLARLPQTGETPIPGVGHFSLSGPVRSES